VDLLGVIRACLRRWYVFFPVVGLTVWLCLQQYRAAVPQYTSTTSFVVVPSVELIAARGQQSAGEVLITTPFVAGNATSTLAGLLTSALNTATVRAQLLPEGGVALAATRDTELDDTLVTVTLVSSDADAVTAAVAAVQAGTNGVLTGLQTGVGAPPTQLYAAVPGGPVDPPLEDYPDRIRAVVALGLAGTLLAVVLSVLAQSLLRGRRKRKDRRPAPTSGAPAAAPPARPPAQTLEGSTASAPARRSSRASRRPVDVRDGALVPRR
jgi:hypothetical protein